MWTPSANIPVATFDCFVPEVVALAASAGLHSTAGRPQYSRRVFFVFAWPHFPNFPILLKGYGVSIDNFATVKALTAEYGHAQLHVGGQAGAGAGLRALTIQNHKDYSLHQRDVLNVVNHDVGGNTLHANLLGL